MLTDLAKRLEQSSGAREALPSRVGKELKQE